MWTPASSWLTSLTACPSPTCSPQCTTVAPTASRTGARRSNSSAGPPHMTSRSPVAARATPPDTGASSSGRPSCASALTASGPIVLITITAASSGRARGRPALAEEGVLRLLGVGDHDHERVGAFGRVGRRGRGARAVLLRGGARPLRVDVEDGELEPGAGQVARHRPAHRAEADEADALHGPQPSSASLASTVFATAPITFSPSPRRSSAVGVRPRRSPARRSRPPAARC